MWVCMAMLTVTDLEVRFSRMAQVTGSDRIFPFWQMLRMTVETADFGCVLPPILRDHSQLESMTFSAIVLLQL